MHFKNKKYQSRKIILATACATALLTPTIPMVAKEIKATLAKNDVEDVKFYRSFETGETSRAKINDFSTTPTNFNTSSLSVGPNVGGPSTGEGYNITDNVGWTGMNTFKYDGETETANSLTEFTATIFDSTTDSGFFPSQVEEGSVLSYKIFPSLGPDTRNASVAINFLNYASTYITVDLEYSDDGTGTNTKLLSETVGVTDQYGYGITPTQQGDSKVLYADQWNSKVIDLNPIAGKYVQKILLEYKFSQPIAQQPIVGYVDDIKIAVPTPVTEPSNLTEYVDTRRGTNSSGSFSRGNNFPATATPNGFNFYTPVSIQSDSANWLYQYKENASANNLPELNGFAISHEPSPWMGDRNRFEIMPTIKDVTVRDNLTRNARKLEYQHENEIAQPDYYSVTFENNIKVEMTPTSHAAVFKVTYPSSQTSGSLIFDSYILSSNTRKFDFVNNTFSGWVDGGSNLSVGRSRMFIYGEFTKPPSSSQGTIEDYGTATFDTSNNQPIEIRVSSSFISLDQAKKNFQLELMNNSSNLTFDQVKNEATSKWQERLSAIDLKGSNATYTQKVTMYSNLYRLNLYPNEQFENTGTLTNPIYQYASPMLPQIGTATDTNTNAQISNGKMYVNNGFWDTYRTVWPTYSLLYPKFAQELVEGFLLQYQDSGYVARWSSPGHADLMTGTSSDAAFSDAYISGAITNITTALNIYKSNLANALRYSEASNMGRKLLNKSEFLGYMPFESSSGGNAREVTSWSLESYISDYAIGQMAIKLANDKNLSENVALSETGQTKQEILDTGNYLLRRSENFQKIFDTTEGFFRAKDGGGNFLTLDGEPFDPLKWGNEFTETNGWNYAFSVPFDIPGLIGIYGGQNQLLSKLDTFFATPEKADHPGSYGETIHEMIEARDVRLGELGMSNQPSHHIPYMYAASGRPSKTQALTREILQRLYVGSDIGQGYCGDEDNGEMSAWGILSSLGLYDLALGSGKYTVTSPLFTKAIVNRDNGDKLNILANNNNVNNKYISSLKIDNKFHTDVYISQDEILKGNHTLEFNMSNIPTSWGNKNIDGKIPTDINNGAVGYDVFASDDSNIAAAIDNDATTSVTFNGNNVSLQWDATLSGTNALTINMFTITSAFDYQKFNKIQLLGSDNGNKWTSLCSVNNQLFQYRYQTKQYSFDTTKNYNHYKLVLVMDTNVQLAEVQLLTSDYIPHHKNSNNNTLWIVLGTVGALVVAGGIALAITIPLRIRKKRQTKLEN